MKYLIVGLGNIGKEYENTRHNLGFDVLFRWAQQDGFKFEMDRHAAIANFKYKGKTLHLLLPTTYMNLSGKAVRYWKDKLNIPLENILVIVDDLALDVGVLRLRTKGHDGGHNGLKNIDLELQSNQYARLRFGIGSNFSRGKQIDYVLQKWSAKEWDKLGGRMDIAIDICKSFCTEGVADTMSNFNNK
ncbi:MAG: aminoacyl-tRNA hydrolase [Chitinophagales bacterium]|nr:aminoacyl-tRNA hydrolase [Chitinophagales bacterium]